MQIRTKQTWLIGLFTLVVLLGGVLGYQFLKGRNLFNKSSYYYSYFNNIGGLYVSNRVVINGLSVGYVSDLHFANDGTGRILAQICCPSTLRLQYTAHSQIVNAGLIGGSVVKLYDAWGEGPYLKSGDTIPGSSEMPYTEALATKLSPLIANIDTTVNSLKGLLQIAEHTITPQRAEQTYEELYSLLRSLRMTASALPATVDNVNRTAMKFASTADSVQNLLTTTYNGLKPPLRRAFQRTDSLLIVASQLVRDVEAGRGTIGKMAQDDSLYYELRSSVRGLDSLLADIQRNPKRYFKFSIF